ncbi:MAG: Type 1 glutamine amidotransferase-like domain-containing protein [Erysipelothrix sp.]
MIFYQLSGPSDEMIGFDPLTFNSLKKDLPNLKSVVVFASNPNDYDVTDDYFNRNKPWFVTLSNTSINYEVIDYRCTRERAHELVKNADLIHFMGGDPFIEKSFLVEYGFDCVDVFNNKVLLGTSAGAMIMGPVIIDTTESLHVEAGFGWVSTSIIPHVVFEESIDVRCYIEYAPVLLIADDGGIRHEFDSFTLLNQVLVIEKNQEING